jgi:hypothetical protein
MTHGGEEKNSEIELSVKQNFYGGRPHEKSKRQSCQYSNGEISIHNLFDVIEN